MKQSHEQIQSVVEAETELFCRATHERQTQGAPVGAVHGDIRLYARETNCGSATAFLQHGLALRHGIEAERLVGLPGSVPRDPFGRRLQHVILRHENTLIDPTYGQLFQYAGVRAADLGTSTTDYPDALALLVDVQSPDDALDPLAEQLFQVAISERAEEAHFAPFKDLGRVAIREIVGDVYNPDNYQLYPVRAEHPSFAYTQRLLDIGDSLAGK